MLDNETKRRIDEARDILVGKLPDPKSQVEQITIALIYKFMYDMDKEALDFGGKATFFTGEWEKYNWINIFDPKIGGHEMLNLYGEAIVKLNLNPNIPQLFRDIFKNAYLPYRDPETLKLFLKTINGFTYDHSERLGDAFEYLLSVLGSQGDAGQFRTPRHIIDFIVAVLQPKKNETICDPACGTAGFLISSYKYIVEQNTKKNKGDLLTPEDKKKMMQRFIGYDISPDMVRLSLVNMYLHNFTSPKIYEYDTLTSEDKWNESFDIIMANPPFMSPKGGIKPHKKFTMQANRSEVLFVDYIAEHINPSTGRAGIIVPEGIIFQSANAYKQLRQLMVDKKFLYAVVSLPAGIFQPYSGVKTSILLMDRTLAKKTDNILFVKIENDGFDLGAQRRAIDKNDLTAALIHLQDYKEAVLNNIEFKSDNKNVFVIEKKVIKGIGDYNLSVDRYRVNENIRQSNFDMVRLDEVFTLQRGYDLPKQEWIQGQYPIVGSNGIIGHHNSYKEKGPGVVTGRSGTIGKVHYIDSNFYWPHNTSLFVKDFKGNNPKFIKLILEAIDLKSLGESTAAVPSLDRKNVHSLIIPNPRLEIQQQIVNKIESYQAIINGAKQVVQNYKPQIDIDPDWEMVELGEVCNPEYGYTDSAKDKGDLRFIRITDIDENGKLKKEDLKFIDLTKDSKQYLLKKNDVVVARTGATYGKTLLFNENYQAVFASYLIRLNFDEGKVLPKFYWCFSQSENYWQQAKSLVTGGGQPQFNANAIRKIQISLPPLSTQQQISNRIEQEQQLVNANKELIKIYEQKIKDEINKLWRPAAKEYKVEGEKLTMAAEE